MTAFEGGDATRLVFHETGDGPRLVCVPGGPMQASEYLGDLGGLGAHRTVVRLDLRGTGASAVPTDPSTYRCDRQVEDLEALRVRLGEAQLDLLGHSAGASLAVLYAVRHPHRVRTLTLVTPSPRVVGVDVADDDRRRVAQQRRGEPWFPAAYAAFERIWAGAPTDADWDAITPFTHGRWDAAEQATAAADAARANAEAAAAYYGDGTVDVDTVRAGLAELRAPVLVIAGGVDVALPPAVATTFAGLFPHAELAVLPGAGHFPWRDDAPWCVDTVAGFLARADRRSSTP